MKIKKHKLEDSFFLSHRYRFMRSVDAHGVNIITQPVGSWLKALIGNRAISSLMINRKRNISIVYKRLYWEGRIAYL